MILYIKNMVCNRCILVLEQVLVSLGLQFNRISMGEVELKKQPSTSQMLQLNLRLIQLGFEILDDQKQKRYRKD